MECKDKVAIVTGAAGKGMGRSIALTLAREGAKVVVNYLSSAKEAGEIVSYIQQQGGRALAVGTDVFKLEECEAMVEKTTRQFGQVDICIIGPGADWHTETIDKLNVKGALDDMYQEIAPLYNLMSLVLPDMYERRWGRLIGISMGFSKRSPSFAYDAAKASRTHAILRARDDAWSHGVTVNIIAPGPVAEVTSLEEAIELCNHGQKWEERNNITPQDIAEGVALLCSEAGRFITGCELPYMFY
jgi:NAD(P)-dependent dehydrogenase (short-subunit alcohol dehydrogenase family)